MRQISQLPSVLFDLARLPGINNLLRQPQALANFLASQAWPDEMEEAAELESEEAEELAEMTPLVEQWLAELPEQHLLNLSVAMESLVPGSEEYLRMMSPIRS